MKNIWKVIIVALCVVLLAALVAVAVYADEQSENVTKLGSVQVTTSGSVNMKFKYEAIDESIDYFVVEINGDKYMQVPGNVVEESNRTVTVALRPDQMASQVTVYAAIDGDETKYAEKSYSVRDYAMTILNNEDYADYHASMRGLLNWGAMADMYFNQKTSSLINKGIYSDGTNPVNDTESFAHGDVTANQGENINAEGYEVFLNPGDTVMRVYFSYAGSGDMKATISKAGSIVATGGDQAPIIKDPKQEDWYYVNITNLGIAVYDKQYTISVTVDGNDTASSTITVLEYLNVIASTEGNDNYGAARQHLARSMYQFYAQARNIVVEGCAHLTGVHNRYESLVEKVFCSNCFEELREVPTHDVSFEKVVDGSTTTYRYICNCDKCEGELLYQRVINSVVFHADITNVSSTVFDIEKPIDERNQVPVVTEIDKDGLVYTHVETLGNQVQTIIESTDVPAGMVMYVKYRLNNGNTPNGYMHTRITVTTEDGVEHLVSDGRVDNADLVKHHDGWVVGRINVKGNFTNEGLTSGAVAKAVTLTITHFDDLDIAYFIAEPTEDNVNGLPYVYSMGDDYYMHWDTVVGSFRADEWRKINDAHTGGDKQTDPEGGYFNPPAVERDPVYIEEIVVKIPHEIIAEKTPNSDGTTTYTYTCVCENCEGSVVYRKTLNSAVYHADITTVTSTVTEGEGQADVTQEITEDGMLYTHVATHGNYVQTVITAENVPATAVIYVKYRLANGTTPEGYMHSRVSITSADGVEHLISDGKTENTDLVKRHNSDLANDGWVVARVNAKGAFDREGLTAGANAKAYTITITHRDDLDIAYIVAEPTEDNVNGLPYVTSMGDDYYLHVSTYLPSYIASQWRLINGTSGVKQNDPFTPPTNTRVPVYVEEIEPIIEHNITYTKTIQGDSTIYQYWCDCENCDGGKLLYQQVLKNTVAHADITTITSSVNADSNISRPVTTEIAENGVLYAHVATQGSQVKTTFTIENAIAGKAMYLKYRLSNGGTPTGSVFAVTVNYVINGETKLIATGNISNADLIKRHTNVGWVVGRINAQTAVNNSGAADGVGKVDKIVVEIIHSDDLDIAYFMTDASDANILPAVESLGDDYYMHQNLAFGSYIADQWRKIKADYSGGDKQYDSSFTYPGSGDPVIPEPIIEHNITYTKTIQGDSTIYQYWCDCENCDGGKLLYQQVLKNTVAHADITTITSSVNADSNISRPVTTEIAENGVLYAHVATQGSQVKTTFTIENAIAGKAMYLKYRLSNGGTPTGSVFAVTVNYVINGETKLIATGNISNADLIKRHTNVGWVVGRINAQTAVNNSGAADGVGKVDKIVVEIIHSDDLDIAYFMTDASDANILPAVESLGDDYYMHQNLAFGSYIADQWRKIKADYSGGDKQYDSSFTYPGSGDPVIPEPIIEHNITSSKKVNSDGTTTYTYRCICENCEGSVVYRKTLNSAVYHADITTVTSAIMEGENEPDVSQEIAEDGMVYSHVATHGSYVTTTISAENVPAGMVMYVKYRLANGGTPEGYMASRVTVTTSDGVEHLVSDGKVENSDLVKNHKGWVVSRINVKGNFTTEGITSGAVVSNVTLTITHRDDLDIAYFVAEPTEDNVNGLPYVYSMGDDYYLHVSTYLGFYQASQWRLINGTSGVKQNDPFTPPANTRTPVYIEEGVEDFESVEITYDSVYAPKIQYAVDLDSSVAAVLNNAANVNTFDSGTPLRIDVVYMLKAKKVLFQIVDYYGNTVYSKELEGTIGQKIKLTKIFAEHPTGYFTIKIAGEVVDTYVVTPSLGNRTLTDSPFAMDTGLTQHVSQAHVSSFASAMRLVGVTWVRERMDWNKYQTGDNGDGTYAYDNTYLNEISTKLTKVKGTGLNVLLTFSGSPSWATSLAYSYGGSNVNSNSYIYLGTYGTQLAIYDASYKLAMELANCVDMIEFSNEPDHNSMLDMAEQYASWFKSAALGVVDAGTGMKVSIAGMCSNPNDYEYLPLLLESGIMDYSSIFNYHSHKYEMPAEDTIYDFTSGTSKNPREIATLLEIYGINQPAWISESGMKLPESTPSEDDKIAQAPYLVTSAVQALSMGNDKYFWFIGSRWQESGGDFSSFTSGENASDTPKPYPTIAAYSVLTDMLGEGKYIGELKNLPASGRGYLFDTGKSIVAVLWMKEGTGTYSFTSGKAVVKTDIMGQQTTLSAGTISIDLTCEPIYLTFNGEAPDYYEDYYYSNEIEKEELSVPVLDDAQHIVITPEFEGFTFGETTHNDGHYITSGTKIKVRVVNHGEKAITGTVSVTIPYFSVSADKSEITVEPHSEGFITLTLTKTGYSYQKVDDFVKFTGEFTDGEQILTCSPAVVSVYSDTNSDFNIIRTFNSDIKFNTITNNSVLSDFKFTVSGSTDSLSDIVVMVDGEVFTNYTYNSFSKRISMDLSGLDEGIHYVSIGFKTDGGDLELIPRLKIRVGETQFVISNEW